MNTIRMAQCPQAPESSGSLQLASIQLSRAGVFVTAKSSVAALRLDWDCNGVRVIQDQAGASSDVQGSGAVAASGVSIAKFQWAHVSGVWAGLRSRRGEGFHLELTMETSFGGRDCELDFLCCSVARGESRAGGDLLSFLEKSQAGRLKDGKAPSFVTSRLGCLLYMCGFSMRPVRVALSRASMILEVLFSLCFFTTVQSIFTAREDKLVKAWGAVADDLLRIQEEFLSAMPSFDDPVAIMCALMYGWPAFVTDLVFRFTRHTSDWLMILMLMQHVLTMLFVLDQFWRTIRSVWLSFSTFHKATVRIHKAVSNNKPGKRPRDGSEPELNTSKAKRLDSVSAINDHAE